VACMKYKVTRYVGLNPKLLTYSISLRPLFLNTFQKL
jgi:hypothetical protein